MCSTDQREVQIDICRLDTRVPPQHVSTSVQTEGLIRDSTLSIYQNKKIHSLNFALHNIADHQLILVAASKMTTNCELPGLT